MLGLDLGLRVAFGQWRASVLAVLIVAGVLAPVLVLWGLKTGTLTGLTDELRGDPRNLEIRLVGDNRLGPAELGALAALPNIGFLQPATRALAARAYLSRADGSGREAVSLLPSGAGDPLLTRGSIPVPGGGEAVLSSRAAAALRLSVGDSSRLSTQRENGAGRLSVDLRVVGILDADLSPSAQTLVAPQLLEEIEAFLDGFAVPRLGIGGRAAESRVSAPSSARLYASEIEAVPGLVVAIEHLGYDTLSQSADIERLLALGGRLDEIVAVLAALLVAGCAAALGANVLAVFDRQRRAIALLRLMGGSRGTVACFVLGFGLATGLAGLGAALGTFGAACGAINRFLPLGLASQRPSCLLPVPQLAVAGSATLALVLLVTLVAALRFSAIPPAGALRAE
ncbi:hypothetical protein [Aureimonas psammosilenae]|uniref:hypothetical protein n=1 Tax=Aureimonas psammosilenae TaxID=2495496 RepID=UPI00186A85A5|nr:hypothetical protein [Aureimonas psammosilenae]